MPRSIPFAEITNTYSTNFDGTGDGFLSKSEVAQLLEHQLGYKPTGELLTSYFAELDANDDGQVSLDEYLTSLIYSEKNMREMPTAW